MQINLKVEHRDVIRYDVIKRVSMTFDTTHKVRVEVEIRAEGIGGSLLDEYISCIRGALHDLVGDLIRGDIQAKEMKDHVFDNTIHTEYGRSIKAKVKAIWVNLL